MYSIDTVRMVMADGDGNAAGKELQEATELYRKGSDTAKSIELFKRSILLRPTAKAYFELAGALLSSRQYKEGLDALTIAEKLGYTPLANLMFRYAYAYANIPDDATATTNSDAAVTYMELAIQMGYAHPLQFLKKDIFPNLSVNRQFDATYTAALSGGAGNDPEKSLWNTYQVQFPEIQLPMVIDNAWINAHKPQAEISYQYERFIPEIRKARFSREGGDTYYYIALIKKDARYVAVLYCTVPEEVDGPNEVTQFYLISYSREGKIIDKMSVAGRSDLSGESKLFSIQPNLHFQVREGNEPPQSYQIAGGGKFERTEPPLALR
ncbi:MAG TPA: hypothetical protein VE035_11770 [Puia sp.]|nr:hypothetical protein [Puia sp.]